MIKLLPGLLLAIGLGLLVGARSCEPLPLVLSEACGAPTKGVGYLFLGLALLALAWARMGKGGEGCKGCTL